MYILKQIPEFIKRLFEQFDSLNLRTKIIIYEFLIMLLTELFFIILFVVIILLVPFFEVVNIKYLLYIALGFYIIVCIPLAFIHASSSDNINMAVAKYNIKHNNHF